jgi:uncharacterized membrane protein YcaP (DUF421 family)
MAHDLVHLGLPWWDKTIRTIVVYAVILALLRVFGKRQLAQLNAFDLVLLLLLSNVVQNAVIGNETSLPGGLLGAAVLVLANVVLVRLAFVAPRFGRLLQGTATTLYRHGRFDDATMRSEQLTQAEVVAALRRQGLELDDAEEVALEPEGTFNVTPRPKPGIEDVLERLDRIERRLGAER